MSNNDIIFIFSENKNVERRYLFGIKESGEYIFKDKNGGNLKILNSTNINSLNAINIKLGGKEYPLVCSNIKCELIDYENDIIYHQDLFNFFNNTHLESKSLSLNYYFNLINLNNENKILFNIIYNETINLAISNILSKDLTEYDNSYNNYENY